jgi:glycosyltransferase involved in cell wall biosynthesis
MWGLILALVKGNRDQLTLPVVSVIMAVHNGERYLNQAISSILNQTFTDYEFIIINDGSTDNTLEMLREFNDDRIIIIDQKNIGLTKSLNKCIRISRGKYIARMDDSDICPPERLLKEYEYLENNPEYALVGTSSNIIDTNGHKVSEVIPALTHSAILKNLHRRNQFSHGSILIRKKILERIGGYRELFWYCQDYDMYLRMINNHLLANLKYVGYEWRDETDRLSVKTQVEKTVYRTLARLLYYERVLYGKEIYINIMNNNSHTILSRVKTYYFNTPNHSLLYKLFVSNYRKIDLKHYLSLLLIYLSGTESLLFKLVIGYRRRVKTIIPKFIKR